jgi:Flp pilus assembly pilin Flp
LILSDSREETPAAVTPSKKNRATALIWTLPLWRDETGQDLIEYSLLIAFVALCAVGLMVGIKSNNAAIWSALNTQLLSAQTAAS